MRFKEEAFWSRVLVETAELQTIAIWAVNLAAPQD